MSIQSETQEKRYGPRILAAVIAVLLIAALVYLQRQEGRETMPAPPAPAPAEAPEAPQRNPGALERGDQARRIIADLQSGETARDLDAIFARAKAFQKAGQVADAYLLYFYAAREGDAASALMLGRMYDPTGPADFASLVDEPIAAQAYKWYRAAADAGAESARDYLANLRGWAEDAAARGDPEARQLLMIWQ